LPLVSVGMPVKFTHGARPRALLFQTATANDRFRHQRDMPK
jgi:hypothetical protein